MTEDRPRAASSPVDTEERRVSITAPPRTSNGRRSSFTDWLFLDERRSSVAAIKRQESAEEEALATDFESLEAWDRTHEPLRDADRWAWLSETSGPIETMSALLASTIEMLQCRGKAEEAYVSALRECHAPLSALPMRAAAASEPELAQPIGSLGMRTQAAEDAASSRAFALTQAVAQLKATATTFGDEAFAVRAEVEARNKKLQEVRAAWRRRWDALAAAHGRKGAQAGGVQASAAVQTEEEDMWLHAHRYLTAAAAYASEHTAQSTCELAQRKRIGLARERACAALGAVLAAGASDDFGRPHAPTPPSVSASARSWGAGWSGRSDSGGGGGGGSTAGASAGVGGWSWRSDDTVGSEAASLASSSAAAGKAGAAAAAWELPPNPYEVCSGAVSRLSEGLLRARWVGEWAVLTHGRTLLTFDAASAPPRGGGGLPAEAPAAQLACVGAQVEWARGANCLSLRLAAAASPVGAAVRSRLGLATKAPQLVQLEFADAATAGTWAAALGAEADE